MSEEDLGLKAIVTRLNKLRRDIEDAKQELSEKKGRREQIISDLKTRFNCKSVKEAQTRINTIENRITRRNKDIEKGFKVLQEKYDF